MRRGLLGVMIAMLLMSVAGNAEAQLFPSNPWPTQPPAVAPDFAALTGQWSGHGRYIEIESSGRAVYRYRTYSPCTMSERKPCDGRGEDFYGGKTIITFTSIEGNTVRGRVDESNNIGYFPLGPIRLELREHGIADLIDQINGAPVSLCGPKYAEAPAEIHATSPCGA